MIRITLTVLALFVVAIPSRPTMAADPPTFDVGSLEPLDASIPTADAPAASEAATGRPEGDTARDPGDEPGEVGGPAPGAAHAVERMVDSARQGQWRLVAAALITILMLALRNFRERFKMFHGDRGGAILVGVISVGTAIAGALGTHEPIDWRLFVGAIGVAWTAVGGYTWIKRILWPAESVDPSNRRPTDRERRPNLGAVG